MVDDRPIVTRRWFCVDGEHIALAKVVRVTQRDELSFVAFTVDGQRYYLKFWTIDEKKKALKRFLGRM